MAESSTAATAAAAKRLARRIPEDRRKRNAQSCDRCRKRRCKCVPSSTGTGCVTCLEHNVPCSYTSPRKTRFYGSLDDLSDRYQCLEAIVKGAFPNESLNSVSELQQLGQRMGYQMPNLSDRNRRPVKIEELVHTTGSQRDSSQFGISPSQADTLSSGPEGSQHDEDKSGSREGSNSEEPQSSLIRDPSGNEHYIGPSGTLNFLSQLRKLVDSDNASPGAGIENTTKFMMDDTAQALEADEQREGEAEATPAEAPDTGGDGPSPGSMTSAIAKDFTRLPTADMEEVLRSFPPDETLEALIQSYFKNVHNDFSLFHRATFEDEYELYIVQARRRSQMPRGRPRALPDWGWIGCLHMIIVFGSIADRTIPGVEHVTLRRKSITATRALLPQFISKCTLSNVRVLLLLALFLHNNNERNASSNLVGLATRISFALGLHRSDMSSSFRPLEREVRKWVFCTLYSFEQFLASALGRPSGLQEIDVEIVPPREGFVDGGIGTDAKLVSWSLRLQNILARTRLIYVGKRPSNKSQAAPTVEEVLASLDKWKHDISQAPGFDLPWIKSQQGEGMTPSANEPNAMDLEDLKVSMSWKTPPQLRAVLLLHIQFHYIAIVATRPVLLRDIAMLRKSAAAGNVRYGPMSPASELCVKHACQLGYLIVLLDSFHVINGLSGLDIFYAYCSAMILILRLLRTPRSDASPQTEPDLQQDPSQQKEDELRECLRSLIYKVQDVINRAEKAGSMKRFGLVVDKFAECIADKPNKLPPLANHSAFMVAQQAQRFPASGQNEIMSNLGYSYSSLDQMMDPGQMGQFTGTNMEGLLDFLPLTTFGGNMAEGGPLTQFLGTEDIPMPEWSDMEMLLGGYGGPG